MLRFKLYNLKLGLKLNLTHLAKIKQWEPTVCPSTNFTNCISRVGYIDFTQY